MSNVMLRTVSYIRELPCPVYGICFNMTLDITVILMLLKMLVIHREGQLVDARIPCVNTVR